MAMIPASTAQPQPPAEDWRRLWRDAITDAHELLQLLGLDHLHAQLPAHDAGFALRVPRGFVARMRHGDPHDPLLLQVLPQGAELHPAPGFSDDAVGDQHARAAHGVLHKYHGRALLIASGACAVNCRYCFRRHFPYAEDLAAAGRWRAAVDWLRDHPEIEEVILSGGDPLALSTAKLADLTDALGGFGHLRRLRIHSRLPVVLPERIDAELCGWLQALPWQKVMMIHANHANELDEGVAAACQRLRQCGVTVLNQSVLLRGVNDSVDALANLSECLFAIGVLPVYLHQLDRVRGSAHFEVPDEEALALAEGLRARLPGFLLPRLVREVPGDVGKTPLTGTSLGDHGSGMLAVTETP